jgi:hypothetical protein
LQKFFFFNFVVAAELQAKQVCFPQENEGMAKK